VQYEPRSEGADCGELAFRVRDRIYEQALQVASEIAKKCRVNICPCSSDCVMSLHRPCSTRSVTETDRP